MSRAITIGVMIGCLALFAWMADSIVALRTAEISEQIQRDRILNYELSSRLIRLRFKELSSTESEFKTELDRNVLESFVMQERASAERPTELRLEAAMLAINLVRAISFKAPLNLASDRTALLQVKVAFLLQRQRRFRAAIAAYEDLLKNEDQLSDDLRAFAELHLGYCQAVVGNREVAQSLLNGVAEEFAGTHFGDAAAALLNMRAGAALPDAHRSPVELARAGQCAAALNAFRASPPAADLDRYYFHVCQERSGAVDEAVDGFRSLVEGAAPDEVKRKANRRLMMIGEFYGGGVQLREYGVERARELGDDAAAGQLKRAAEIRSRDELLAELKEFESAAPGEAHALLANLRTAGVAGQATRDKELEAARERRRAERSAAAASPTVFLALRTRGGREIRGQCAVFNGDVVLVQSGPLRLSIPAAEARRFAVEGGRRSLELRFHAGPALHAQRIEVIDGGAALSTGARTIERSAVKEICIVHG